MLVIEHFCGTHPQFSRHTISGVGIPIAVQFIVIVSDGSSSIRFGGLTTMVGESRRKYQCKFMLIWNYLNLLLYIHVTNFRGGYNLLHPTSSDPS